MYHVAVHFDVAPENQAAFIAASLKDGRDSAANEPGTRRFELIRDESDPNRFYLNEAYEDLAAFNVHAEGPYFKEFFDTIAPIAEGPVWLIRGSRIEDEA